VSNTKGAKRIVTAPGSTGPSSPGAVLTVEVDPEEDVQWVWSHDREHGSRVTGYVIVPRTAPRDSDP
jgi:hypothetical protein